MHPCVGSLHIVAFCPRLHDLATEKDAVTDPTAPAR